MEAQHPIIVPDGTVSLLHFLVKHPGADVRCSVGPGEPAIAVYQTPHGCAVRPDDRIQALCPQHIETDGISNGSAPILDLSLNEAWSRRAGRDLPLKLGYTAVELEVFLVQAKLEC